MLDIKKIETKLKEYISSECKILYYEECDSTNTRAKEYAKENPEEKSPVIFIAESQTAGRGRLGRSFHSATGVGIYITFLLYPNISVSEITNITPYLAVKLSEALEEVSPIKPDIKWVNDLYTKGKKLAGILVESQIDDPEKPTYLICGLGINIYKSDFPAEISQIAISVEESIGKKISRESLISELVKNVLSDIDKISSEECFRSYESRLTTIGKHVTVIKPDKKYDAHVKKLNPDYSLTLSLPDGSEEVLFTGEVSIRTK